MRSNSEWIYWGRVDPLWAVAALEGREQGAPNAWTAADFLAMGDSDMADVARHWQSYGVSRGRCIEIGCGSGRMTKALLAHFDSVLAIDVSPDQIRSAATLLGEDAQRVSFALVSTAAIPAADASCDAMFSSHVFQHLSDFSHVERYFAESFRCLRHGGTICFHLPVPGAHRTSEHPSIWYLVRSAKVAIKRMLGQLAVMDYRRYAASRVFGALERVGYEDCQLRIFSMRSNGDAHSYFFARKP